MRFHAPFRPFARRAAFGLAVAATLLSPRLTPAAGPIPVGSIISYQGLLSSSTGAPVADGSQSLTFKIYEDGVEKSSQTIPVQTVKGIFNAFLSVGTLTFDPAKSYELGITHNGTEARHAIAAVPVAVQAKSAAAVSGVVPIENGGTGSATQNFVDLTSAQSVSGAKTFSSLLKGTGGLLLNGTSGATPASGAGTRFMWVPGKAALRAGAVSGWQWDDANIGADSVAFGRDTKASGANSTALGQSTTASGSRSFAVGFGSEATGEDSLAMGTFAEARATGSQAIGSSLARGEYSTAIGLQNAARGRFSTVLGRLASDCETANCGPDARVYNGVISIGDGSPGFTSSRLTATANNQFNVRAVGGIRFFTALDEFNGTGNPYSAGVTVAPGGGSWQSLSDRNAKENFAPVDSRDILRRVVRMPISTWNYKSQARSIRHMGAMAQDFHAAFKLGEGDKTIATIDPDGVALAAIQGLNSELKERDKEISTLKAQNAAFEARLKRLEGHLNAAPARREPTR